MYIIALCCTCVEPPSKGSPVRKIRRLFYATSARKYGYGTFTTCAGANGDLDLFGISLYSSTLWTIQQIKLKTPKMPRL